MSVHLSAPRSWGLYHKAALHSGAFGDWIARTFWQAERQHASLLAAAGCRGPGGLACLLLLDGPKVVDISRSRDFAPTVDGVELTSAPWILLEEGRINREVPLLLGDNKDEGTLGVDVNPLFRMGFDMSYLAFNSLLDMFGVDVDRRQEASRIYAVNSTGGNSGYTNWYWAATHFAGDLFFLCPTRRTARAFSAFSQHEVFQYRFSYTPRAPPPPFVGLPSTPGTAGTFHTAELAFVFLTDAESAGPANLLHLMGQDEQLLSLTMAGYWTNFATSSSPNVGLRTNLTVPWQPFRAGRQASQQLDLPSISVETDMLKSQCNFMDSLRQPHATQRASGVGRSLTHHNQEELSASRARQSFTPVRIVLAVFSIIRTASSRNA